MSIQIAGDVLIVITALLAFANPIAYHLTTRGDWRFNPVGLIIMSGFTAFALVLAFSVIRALAVDFLGHDDPEWLRLVRVIVFVTVPVTFAAQLYLIISTRHRGLINMESDVRSTLKGVVFVLMAVVGPLAVFLKDGVSTSEWISVAVLAAGALVTFFKSNTPANPSVRAVLAISTVVVDAVTTAWTDSTITPDEAVTIIMAFLGAVSLYLGGNDNATLKPAAPSVDYRS